VADKPVIRIKEDPESVALELAKKDWVKHATATSNAMDLEPGLFGMDDPKKIAQSLKRSVEKSKRLKSTPYAAAISMVNFFVNRMGGDRPAALPAQRDD
jgi:hypothetical protein